MLALRLVITIWSVAVVGVAVWFSYTISPWLTQVAGWGGSLSASILLGVASGVYAGWQIAAIWRN